MIRDSKELTQKQLEIKWYKEIQFLANKVNGFYDLNVDERQNIYSDSLLAFLRKVNKGEIQTDHYDQYKAFLFICVKSMVLRQFQNRRYQKNKIFLFASEINETSLIQDIPLIKDVTIQVNINKLTPTERAMIRWVIRGWEKKYIASVMGIPQSTFEYTYRNLKIKLKKYINKKGTY